MERQWIVVVSARPAAQSSDWAGTAQRCSVVAAATVCVSHREAVRQLCLWKWGKLWIYVEGKTQEFQQFPNVALEEFPSEFPQSRIFKKHFLERNIFFSFFLLANFSNIFRKAENSLNGKFALTIANIFSFFPHYDSISEIGISINLRADLNSAIFALLTKFQSRVPPNRNLRRDIPEPSRRSRDAIDSISPAALATVGSALLTDCSDDGARMCDGGDQTRAEFVRTGRSRGSNNRDRGGSRKRKICQKSDLKWKIFISLAVAAVADFDVSTDDGTEVGSTAAESQQVDACSAHDLH